MLKKFLHYLLSRTLKKQRVTACCESSSLYSYDLSKYEQRRQEINDSIEPIDGIFYIYNGAIIPDYYSEVLQKMQKPPGEIHDAYHHKFYNNYMIKKFACLSAADERSIPKGRVYFGIGYLDKCYIKNEGIKKKVVELYQLPLDTDFFSYD